MPRDKALSHEKIIRAAIDEFSEYGYDKASMRRIGERCGLTAAALYRHFDSKEAMFDALVKPAANDLAKWINSHSEEADMAMTCEASAADGVDGLKGSSEIELMRELIYPRMSEYSMLFNKSRGSKYENYLNDLVEDHQKKVMPYLERLRDRGYDVQDITADELHMLITAYCAALFEPIAHDYTFEDAAKYLRTVEAFFAPGWKNLMGLA